MRNKYICDLCGSEVTENTWEDAPSLFFMNSYCASQNPLNRLGYGSQRVRVEIKDTCQTCQRAIASAMTDVLGDLPPKEQP